MNASRIARTPLAAGAGLLALLVVAVPARATDVPLWELGVGAGAVSFGDYRGSDQSHVYPLPVVYFNYNGRFLKSDRDGLHGLFLSNRFAELNISVGATTPVRSHDDEARAGMPDLRPTVEVGPSLDLHLWRSADSAVRLDLRLPVRRAVTIEREPHAVGWFFAPRLNLDWRDPPGLAGWNAGLLSGPVYADRAYHSYFYSVAPQFATATRPEYQARGGYAGLESIAALSRRFRGAWVGAFARYDSLGDAVFSPSPLVRRHGYWAGGVGIAWMVGRSARQVDDRDGH